MKQYTSTEVVNKGETGEADQLQRGDRMRGHWAEKPARGREGEMEAATKKEMETVSRCEAVIFFNSIEGTNNCCNNAEVECLRKHSL